MAVLLLTRGGSVSLRIYLNLAAYGCFRMSYRRFSVKEMDTVDGAR